MNIGIYIRDDKVTQGIKHSLIKGFLSHGDMVKLINADEFTEPDPTVDLACFVGLAQHNVHQAYQAAGKPTLLIDKGYFFRIKHCGFLTYKFSLNGYKPSYFDKLDHDTFRFRSFKIPLRTRRLGGKNVIYCGSSNKHALWHGLSDTTMYALDVCHKLRKLTTRKILYRPKPKWWLRAGDGVIPPGTELAVKYKDIQALFVNAHCVVTHSSNVAVEALLSGVPTILTGPKDANVAWDLCGHDLESVKDPFWPDEATRAHVMSQIAWCTFTRAEIASGLAWSTVKKHC